MSIINQTKSRLIGIGKAVLGFGGKHGTPYARCPCCGKLSKLSNFANTHVFPDAKIQFSRGGRGRGFFWVQMTDPIYLEQVKGMIEKTLLVLVQRLHLNEEKSEVPWLESKSASIRIVPSTYFSKTGVQSSNLKINVTQSQLLKISKSSLKK